MNFFDFLDSVKYNAGRFFWPVSFLIVGIVLLKMGLVPEIMQLNNATIVDGVEVTSIPVSQNTGFLMSSLFFIGASIVWFFYLLGIIKSFLSYAVMLILAVAGGYLIYSDFNNIKSTLDFDAAVDIRDRDIKARMDDIKQAQLAYKEMNGVYTDSVDDLIAFVKTGKKMKIKKEGSVPERKISVEERDFLYGDDRPIDKLMTEREAALLAASPFKNTDTTGLDKFLRDTIYESVMEAVFLDDKRIEARSKLNPSLAFNADSLGNVPHSSIPVKLDTGTVVKSEVNFPTLYIEMPHPMNADLEKPIIYSIGDKNKNDNTLRESWLEK